MLRCPGKPPTPVSKILLGPAELWTLRVPEKVPSAVGEKTTGNVTELLDGS